MRVLSALAVAMALGCGGSSGPLPPAPQGLTAQPQQAAVLLQWTGVADAATYEIYTAVSAAPVANGKTTRVVATGASTYTVLVNGLVSGVAYHFAVSAVNGNGQGPLSAEAVATPQ